MDDTIIVAVIGAVVSVFTVVAGKIYETKVELRKIKEEQYIGFLSNLISLRRASDNEEKTVKDEELSIKVQTIYLVGSVGVQKALNEYLEIFKVNNQSIAQDERYGRLIQEMKIDLYGRKFFFLPKRFRSIDKIQLTVFKG